MTTIKHKESVELNTFKENAKNAEHFNPLKLPQKQVYPYYGRVHTFYIGKERVSKNDYK